MTKIKHDLLVKTALRVKNEELKNKIRIPNKRFRVNKDYW